MRLRLKFFALSIMKSKCRVENTTLLKDHTLNDAISLLPPCLANSLCHLAVPTCCDVLGNSCVLGQHQKSCGHSAVATTCLRSFQIRPSTHQCQWGNDLPKRRQTHARSYPPPSHHQDKGPFNSSAGHVPMFPSQVDNISIGSCSDCAKEG